MPDSLVILGEDCDLSDGHPGPLPGPNDHSEALDTLREEHAEVVGIHLSVLKILDVCKALA